MSLTRGDPVLPALERLLQAAGENLGTLAVGARRWLCLQIGRTVDLLANKIASFFRFPLAFFRL